MKIRIDPAASQQMKVIAGAMGMGVAMLWVMILFFYFQNARAASPENVRFINMMTAFAMGGTVAAIVASEAMWKSLLSQAAPEEAGKAFTSAFIVRSACREGAAMMGSVTALLAALNGVLRANPAYWINAAPTVLFFSYLYVHWPSVENMEAELSQFPKFQ
jgi:hypothetical protein